MEGLSSERSELAPYGHRTNEIAAPDIFLPFHTSNKRKLLRIDYGLSGGWMGWDTEILIIGGGPAGLAAAIASRKRGFAVTVADGAKPPIDKPCGEGLMPTAMEALRELGVAIRPGDGQVLRGVRFLDAASSVEANYSGASGFGVRRIVLHQRMLERAQECGVQLLWNTPVERLCGGGAIVGGKAMKARWIIGADGIHSRVRNWIGLGANVRQEMRFAQRRHYRMRPWTDCMEIHWGQKAQAYVTPLSNDETCVSLISRHPRMRLEAAWREFPNLASYLRDAKPSSAERGAVTVTCRLGQVYRGSVALIGDASGSVDAITAEGLSLSFHQAIALADAIGKGKLANYRRAHRTITSRPNTMGRLLLLLDRYPSLRRRALRGLAADPELFARLLTAHLGETSSKFLAALSLRAGWQFLTA
jgi:menaquinone-9 beta-reductase